MSIGNDLKRYHFLDFIEKTVEFKYLYAPEIFSAMDQCFNEEYLGLFLDELLAGSLLPSLLSEVVKETETVKIIKNQGDSNSDSVSNGDSNSGSDSGVVGDSSESREQGSEEVAQIITVHLEQIVGNNFNAR